ncbi:HNH endonuclease [Macrococcoides caseolyticum]|uniref:HNH endonuclease n=1 Tax=Macrococcoides caseolyticum TaxID=69966 RepID=UPI0024BCE36C|nr:HNH endonuclease [Macrococcus caseolyticus]MDJ1087923.1 HNH endonuclease [Macrococcus caseolyticus]
MDPNLRTLLLKKFISLKGIEITEFKKTFSNIEFPEIPGKKYHMVSAGGRGIYKPKNSPLALSIRCDKNNNPYNDKISFDKNGNFIKLEYHGPESDKLKKRAQNDIDSLIACYKDEIPIGIIYVLDKKKSYMSLGLGIIKNFEDNIFEIIPYHLIDNSDTESNQTLIESDDLLTNINTNKVIERQYNLKVRTAQSFFRNNLLKKYHKCFLCVINFKPLLVASHIKPWAYCKDEEKIDIENGLILCSHHDTLFDKGYLTFVDGYIRVSNLINKENLNLDINALDKKYSLSKKQKVYMKFHNTFIFKR